MGRPNFGRSTPYPAPPLPHALHDDDVDGVVAEGLEMDYQLSMAFSPSHSQR